MASGAGAAPVKPISISIKTVLNMLGAELDAILAADASGHLPGLAFHVNQLEVALVSVVPQQGVGQLVQNAILKLFKWLAGIIGDGVGLRRPPFTRAFNKAKLWIVGR